MTGSHIHVISVVGPVDLAIVAVQVRAAYFFVRVVGRERADIDDEPSAGAGADEANTDRDHMKVIRGPGLMA